MFEAISATAYVRSCQRRLERQMLSKKPDMGAILVVVGDTKTTVMDTIRFSQMFSSFSVNDLESAYNFYAGILGLEVTREPMGILSLRQVAGGEAVMVYPKPDHQAATFTVLNLGVDDLEAAVDALTSAGIVFEQYQTQDIQTDAKGISRGEEGPAIAWFKDPAGNIVSVIEGGGDM